MSGLLIASTYVVQALGVGVLAGGVVAYVLSMPGADGRDGTWTAGGVTAVLCGLLIFLPGLVRTAVVSAHRRRAGRRRTTSAPADPVTYLVASPTCRTRRTASGR